MMSQHICDLWWPPYFYHKDNSILGYFVFCYRGCTVLLLSGSMNKQVVLYNLLNTKNIGISMIAIAQMQFCY